MQGEKVLACGEEDDRACWIRRQLTVFQWIASISRVGQWPSGVAIGRVACCFANDSARHSISTPGVDMAATAGKKRKRERMYYSLVPVSILLAFRCTAPEF